MLNETYDTAYESAVLKSRQAARALFVLSVGPSATNQVKLAGSYSFLRLHCSV